MADEFVDIPLDTEPPDLAQKSYDYLQARIADWEPRDGNLETWIIEAIARQAAEVAALAAAVPRAIFKTYGEKIINLAPIEAAAAIGETTWVMRDTAGYTIPAGTVVSLPTTGDTSIAFATTEEVIVPPGSASTGPGAVMIQAVNPGVESDGLTGTPQLLDILDFVSSVSLVGETEGGQDAETEDEYLDRLAQEMQLLTPRPIVARDFALLAMRVPGVGRAIAIDAADVVVGFIPEIQTISNNGAVAGTFTLTFSAGGPQTTAAIAYNAGAATIQSALEALSNIAPGDIVVSGGPIHTSPVTVQFQGAYAGTDVPQMTGSGTNLVIANEMQYVEIVATGGTFTLTYSGQTTGAINWNASAAAVQTALEALSNLAPGDVQVDLDYQNAGGGAYVITFMGTLEGDNLALITANGTNLTGPGHSITVSAIQDGSQGITIVVNTNQEGSNIIAPQERTVVIAAVDDDGEPVLTSIKGNVADLLQAMREINFVVLVIDATYTTIGVNYTAVAAEGWDADEVQDRADAALAEYLDPANWGLPATGDQRLWLYRPTVRYLEVAEVLSNVEGLDYITLLQTKKNAGGFASVDITLDGQTPLTRAGTITGSVTAE
jgi:hypothetical protein